MAQVIVRNLDDDVKDGLKRRAKQNGRSMEDEVRHILRAAVKGDRQGVRRLGSRIAARFRTHGLEADVPELHGQAVRPAEFKR